MSDFNTEDEIKIEKNNVKLVYKNFSEIDKELTQKMSLNDWNIIETFLQENERNVLNMLKHYIDTLFEKDLKSHNTTNYKVLGEEIYLKEIRNKYKDILNLNTLKIIKTQSNKQNKIDEIRLQNLNKIIQKFISMITNKYTKKNTSNVITHDIISLNIIEFIGITLIYQLNNYINILKATDIKNNIDFIYKNALGTFTSLKLFLKKCECFSGCSYLKSNKNDIKISVTLLIDIENTINKFTELNYGNIKDIVQYAPSLLVKSDHVGIIPNINLKPHITQEETLQTFIKYFEDGILVFSNDVIGSGKTTLIIPIAQYVINKRIIDKKYKNLQLVFCCNIFSVKLQAANLCHNAGIPFGMAHIGIKYYDKNRNECHDKSKLKKEGGAYKSENNEVCIVNNFNCSNNNERIVIIGDPDVIYRMFSENSDNYNENYILFLDEPTVGLDYNNINTNTLLNNNVNLLLNLPKRSLLTSATMPHINTDSIQYIIQLIKNKYKDLYVKTIYGTNIFIGCNVTTFDNRIVIPHNECYNKKEIIDTIKKIKETPFLGRMYTYDIFNYLVEETNQTQFLDVFLDVNYINSNTIKNQTLELLSNINDDDLIKKYCKIRKSNCNIELDINLIGTTESYKFPMMTLLAIGGSDLIEESLNIFNDLIKDFPDNYFNLLINDYNNAVNKYEIKKNELLKSKLNKGNKDKDKDKDKLSKIDLEREIEDELGPVVKININPYLRINSEQHIKKYNNKSNIQPKVLFSLENIDYDFNISDKIKLLLMCGVGIYSPNILDKKYTNQIIRLASNGLLAFVVSNYDISYGTNYPFETVIIDKNFAKKHSLNTIFQCW